MTIGTPVLMDRHRVIGRVTNYTERGVQDMAKASGGVIGMEVRRRGSLVLMAVQAVHRVLMRGGIGNNHLHPDPGRRIGKGIDVTVGVMTGGATVRTIGVLDQDLLKGVNDMAV